MKNIKTLLVFFMLIGLMPVSAQNKNNNTPEKADATRSRGLAISLGAVVNYFYGPSDRNFSKFENYRVNWHANAMLGFTLATDKAGRQTVVGIFGSYGFNNAKTVSQLITDQDYKTAATSQSESNNYFRAEFGVLIADILRLSTGIGQQNFDSQLLTTTGGSTSSESSFSYYSSTVGLQIKFKKISWTIDCNIATGKDFNNTILTPATGLAFTF